MMKVLYDLLIGDSRMLVGVLLAFILAYSSVRVGQPEWAGVVLLAVILLTLLGVTWVKTRR
ncbi:MAG: hypothetical protein IVW51_01055 [Thermaceae bacterium]|nr:hypothetical protein [Thermaceae bacterium]